MRTVEELVKEALSEYDFQDELYEFFEGDIDWIRDRFEPLIKKALEKLLKEHGEYMLKETLKEAIYDLLPEEHIDTLVKEIIAENLPIKKLIERILK